MFADPDNNLIQAEIPRDAIIADLGAGTGAYTISAAALVPEGRVYAIEVQRELLSRVKNSVAERGFGNVEALWGDLEIVGGTKLRDQSITFAILSNVFFQIEDREGFFKELSRIIKPRGRVLLIDWTESFGGMGPDPLRVIRPQTAQHLFESHGFMHVRDIQAGAHHYGMIFEYHEK